MCDALMECFGKISCLPIGFGEGHLNVVEVAYGSRDSQVHRAEFTNQTF